MMNFVSATRPIQVKTLQVGFFKNNQIERSAATASAAAADDNVSQ